MSTVFFLASPPVLSTLHMPEIAPSLKDIEEIREVTGRSKHFSSRFSRGPQYPPNQTLRGSRRIVNTMGFLEFIGHPVRGRH